MTVIEDSFLIPVSNYGGGKKQQNILIVFFVLRLGLRKRKK